MTQVPKKFGLLLIGMIVAGLCTAAIGQEEMSEREKAKLAEKQAGEAEKKRAMLKEAKKKLENTAWEISLRESGTGQKEEAIKDTLRFSDGKIGSDKLVSEGFAASNFTVRIKRENKVIWETMQKNEEGGLAFWRGELPRDEKGALGSPMRGVLSRHFSDKKKTVKDYTFISEGKEKIAPEEGEEETLVIRKEPVTTDKSPVPPAAEKPAEAPVVEAPPLTAEPVKKEKPEIKKEEKKAPEKKRWWQR